MLYIQCLLYQCLFNTVVVQIIPFEGVYSLQLIKRSNQTINSPLGAIVLMELRVVNYNGISLTHIVFNLLYLSIYLFICKRFTHPCIFISTAIFVVKRSLSNFLVDSVLSHFQFAYCFLTKILLQVLLY